MQLYMHAEACRHRRRHAGIAVPLLGRRGLAPATRGM